jgi:serine/threonine protein kinase
VVTSLALQRIEGKYEILEKLGEGGMGAVYKVRHRLLEEIRVIKMMRPQLLQEADLKARFLREARVAIQLRHPSIAQLYDFSLDEDGVASIVMEFIQGITLEALLRHGGPPPLPLALEVAQQTLRALHYLHNKGFVHRDISPDNVMLSEGPDGEPLVKLIDLGIAKTLDGGAAGGYLTQTGTFLGKVRYAPPEQFGESGASAMDGRGDIYSFGIVLYELLTGRYPIRGRDPSSLIAGHLFWPPLDFAESDPAGRIPSGVREVTLRALAKAPDDRFRSAQEMAHALAAFRTPSDLAGLDLAALLRPPATGGSGTLRFQAPPGSTQDRLDLQFGLSTTPSPSQVAEITRAFLSAPRAVPAPEQPVEEAREGEVAAVVAEVEERIARGDYKGGELLLYEAEVDFGSLEVFSALHQRLADERRREMAAKAEARRRAEQIAAAVSEIESRLAQGQIDRAGKLLDETMSSFGDDTISGELRSRLRDLREQAREAELNALLEAARERFEMGDFDGALEAAGQVETIAPGHAAALALREEVGAEIRRREEAARQAEEEARLRAAEERRREEEARRAAALQAAAAGIGELLGTDLDAAGERLTDALEAFGEEEVLLALRPRIAEALHQRAEEARRREEEARERAEEAARREAAFGAHLATVRDLLGQGSLEAAEGELDVAEDLLFGRTETRTLRDEIAAARQLREEARLREEEARQREEEARQREEEAARQREEEERLQREAEARQRAEEEARRQAEEARQREAEAARQREEEARLREEEAARQREEEERLQREAEALQRAEEEAQRQAEEARQREAEAARQREEEARLREEEVARQREEEERLQREEEERRLAAEARQREQEARHEAARQAALAEIDARLDADDLEGAAALLPRAVAGFGDDPLLRARWERLGAAQVERRRRAEEARKADEQAAALAAAIAAIDDSLANGRIEEAARLLPGAVATFGGTPELRERWEKLEILRRQTGAAALALKAETLHAGGDPERAARTARQALDLDAGNRKAAELLRKIERRR